MNNKNNRKITLPEETQKNILKFFIKTSMPRIAKQQREQRELTEPKALSEIKGQETNK